MTYFVSILIGLTIVGLLFVTYCLLRMASIEDRKMEQMRIKLQVEQDKASKQMEAAEEIDTKILQEEFCKGQES